MKKFIRVLIRIIAGVMLLSAIVLVLNNRGVVKMCSTPDKTSRPNENFSGDKDAENSINIAHISARYEK